MRLSLLIVDVMGGCPVNDMYGNARLMNANITEGNGFNVSTIGHVVGCRRLKRKKVFR